MTQTKYYLKEKCNNPTTNWHINQDGFHDCPICHKKGFIRGADVTKLMEAIKSVVTKQMWTLIIGVTKDLIQVVEE